MKARRQEVKCCVMRQKLIPTFWIFLADKFWQVKSDMTSGVCEGELHHKKCIALSHVHDNAETLFHFSYLNFKMRMYWSWRMLLCSGSSLLSLYKSFVKCLLQKFRHLFSHHNWVCLLLHHGVQLWSGNQLLFSDALGVVCGQQSGSFLL